MSSRERTSSSLLLLLLLAASAGPCVPARAEAASPTLSRGDASRLARFEREIEQLRSLLRIPGMSAAVVRDQKVIWARGFGYADEQRRLRATPATPFYIASVTKTFATTLLMRLEEQGKLDLDEPVSRYSRDFKDDRVRIKHLLSHTSDGVPGERHRYNGARFAALTAVLEAKTGKTFRELIADEFLEPLGMSRSVLGLDVLTEAGKRPNFFAKDRLTKYRAALRRCAKPYRLFGDKSVHTTYGWGGISTSAGLLSTVRDLARFDAAIDRHVYLKRETQERVWTPFVSNGGQPLPHGLGWFIQDYRGSKVVWHYGYNPDSASATYVKVPARNLSLILMANSDALSAPFVRTGILETSPFVISFLRTLVLEDIQGRVLPDPNWARSPERFTQEIGRLRERAGDYGYDSERSAHTAMTKWLEQRRRLARIPIKIDFNVYQTYVGRYRLADGLVLTVTKERDRLMIDVPGFMKSRLFPLSSSRFFTKTVDAEVAFVGGDQGGVTVLEVVQDGQTSRASKVE